MTGVPGIILLGRDLRKTAYQRRECGIDTIAIRCGGFQAFIPIFGFVIHGGHHAM